MLFPLFMLGQNQKMDKKRERIEKEKIGFLTSHLNLTIEDAQKFWPIYNEFSNARHACFIKRKEHKKNLVDVNNMTEREIEEHIKKHFLYEQEILDIKKQFHNKFKQVLSNKQIAKLYHAEKEFKNKLLRDLTKKNRR